jgi:hypothetical protein
MASRLWKTLTGSQRKRSNQNNSQDLLALLLLLSKKLKGQSEGNSTCLGLVSELRSYTQLLLLRNVSYANTMNMNNPNAQEPFSADCVQSHITQRCTHAMFARQKAGGASTLSLCAQTAKELTQQTTSSVKLD